MWFLGDNYGHNCGGRDDELWRNMPGNVILWGALLGWLVFVSLPCCVFKGVVVSGSQ